MTMISRRRLLTTMLAASAGLPSATIGAPSGPVPGLEQGGYVIYFRHGATTWYGVDRLDRSNERQRLLSEEGVRQSEITGAAFRARRIPVGDVLASPFARCADMARIAYLPNQIVTAPTEGKNRVSPTDLVSLRPPTLLWPKAKPLPSAPTVAAISRFRRQGCQTIGSHDPDRIP